MLPDCSGRWPRKRNNKLSVEHNKQGSSVMLKFLSVTAIALALASPARATDYLPGQYQGEMQLPLQQEMEEQHWQILAWQTEEMQRQKQLQEEIQRNGNDVPGNVGGD